MKPVPAAPTPKGFRAMDPARQREIASMGGKAAHESGRAHKFTSEEARAAVRKRLANQRAAEAGTGAET